MGLIAKPPHIRLLEAGVATLVLVDWQDRTARAITKIRHTRNRFPTRSEKNSIALRWLGNRHSDIDEQYKNSQETQKLCDIDIEIDMALKSEESEEDPTGWLDISRVEAVVLEALRDPDGALMQLCDWVIDGDVDPDEDSKPDEGRLVKRVSVVYRVRTDAPNVLLAEGENG